MRRRGRGGDATGTAIEEGRWRWIACGNLDGMGIGEGTKVTFACVGNKDGLLPVS